MGAETGASGVSERGAPRASGRIAGLFEHLHVLECNHLEPRLPVIATGRPITSRVVQWDGRWHAGAACAHPVDKGPVGTFHDFHGSMWFFWARALRARKAGYEAYACARMGASVHTRFHGFASEGVRDSAHAPLRFSLAPCRPAFSRRLALCPRAGTCRRAPCPVPPWAGKCRVPP